MRRCGRMVYIEAKELRKVYRTIYGRVVALDDITLNINSRITALIGPNGAGKTTFIKIVLGLVRPTSGSIRVLGEKPGYRNRIAYLPEKPNFPRNIKVRDLVNFVAEVKKIPKEEIYNYLSELNMYAWERKIDALSAGMLQKLALSLVMTANTDLIILDEHTANLDPIWRARVLKMLNKKSHDSAILLSTHILENVEKIASRVVFIINGKIIMDKDIVEILKEKKYRIRMKDGTEIITESLNEYVREDVKDIDVMRKTLGDVFEEVAEMVSE